MILLHPFIRRKKITVHSQLEIGEKLVLLRAQDGQKNAGMDRMLGLVSEPIACFFIAKYEKQLCFT